MKKKLFFKNATSTPIPYNLKPMLATLSQTIPPGKNWIYEIKYDGYRAIAFCEKNKVNLLSRNNKSFNDKFYPIYNSLQELNLKAVLDGEIVVLNHKGIPTFEKLQNWRSEMDGALVYFVFDLLWLDGCDLKSLTLLQRKKLLKKIIPKNGNIKYCDFFTKDIDKVLLDTKKNKLEGIIAKKSDSIYIPDFRSKNWLKIKTQNRQEVIIGGFTINENTPKLFSSLLIGVYENNQLHYIGKVGTGFNKVSQQKMFEQFKPLVNKTCPFVSIPNINQPSRFNPNPPLAKAIWLKPKLVCEVNYIEVSRDGILRHAAFKGMREDKNAQTIHLEVAENIEKNKNLIIHIEPLKDTARKTLLNPKENTQVKTIHNHELKFNNLNKIYWPKLQYTKRDLLNYYYQAADFILPYLINRPQTLNRYPNGIAAKSFYQKDITKIAPTWIHQYAYRTSLGEDKNYLVIEREEDLLWMVNLGVIEINPWSSTIDKENYPTWCMIDIDPSESNTFLQVIKTANVIKTILDELNITSYCKTSGVTGLHIYFPLGRRYTYAECQLLGRLIATEANNRLPKITSIERYTLKRKNKIYIDFLQNRPKATVAAPYSVRPHPAATVSMPLYWDEVNKKLKPTKFTLKNAMMRMQSEGDLFKPILKKGIDLKRAVNLLKSK